MAQIFIDIHMHPVSQNQDFFKNAKQSILRQIVKRPETAAFQRFPGTCQPKGVIPTRLQSAFS